MIPMGFHLMIPPVVHLLTDGVPDFEGEPAIFKALEAGECVISPRCNTGLEREPFCSRVGQLNPLFVGTLNTFHRP